MIINRDRQLSSISPGKSLESCCRQFQVNLQGTLFQIFWDVFSLIIILYFRHSNKWNSYANVRTRTYDIEQKILFEISWNHRFDIANSVELMEWLEMFHACQFISLSSQDFYSIFKQTIYWIFIQTDVLTNVASHINSNVTETTGQLKC